MELRLGKTYIVLPNGRVRLTRIWNINGYVSVSNTPGFTHFYDVNGDRRSLDTASSEFIMEDTWK